VWVGSLLASSGGFLDAFTYVAHGHVFANAMSGNVILLAVAATTGDWRQSLRHAPPILAFLLGAAAAQPLRRRRWFGRTLRASPAILSLSLEMVFLAVAGCLPKTFPDLPLVLGISFLAAFQSSTFLRVEKWTYNSTLTTGNLRQFGEAAFNAVFANTDADAGRRARLFGSICLSFLAGAVLGGLCTPRMNNKSLWIADVLLLLAWLPLMAAWHSMKNPITPPSV
jgi:uncharacterized membrane protein YoaK (UPF0700 family)